MKIRVGDTKPTVLKSGCGNVCHTASADGSTLVADTTITTSASYDLKNNAATLHMQSDDSFAYGGLFPDGTLLMSSTNYLGGFNSTSSLYDTKSGATIAAPGWDGVITKGGTTAFSPDGKQIAFVHEDKDSGHTLAKMDFDVTKKNFSNLADLATDSKNYVAWPAFTPDGKSIVYHAGSSAAFQAGYGTVADLFIVDIATHTAKRLDALDGYTRQRHRDVPARQRHGAERHSDRAAGGGRRLLLGRVHQPPIVRESAGVQRQQRHPRQALGRRGRRERARPEGPQPSRVLSRRAGDQRRQSEGLLDAAALRGGRRDLHQRRSVLRRLLRSGRQRLPVHLEAAALFERARQVHDQRRLLRFGGSLHQQSLRPAAADEVTPRSARHGRGGSKQGRCQGQFSGMLALVPMLDVHWALVLPLNASVTLPPLKELTVIPDFGHMFVHAT